MRYVFLNPNSCGGKAPLKWEKIKDQLPFQDKFIVIDAIDRFDWNTLDIHPNDVFISAGGDGTLHHMVNALIEKKGIQCLSVISVGHIGLGSNNSFLRPYEEQKNLQGIPVSIADECYEQDLISITIDKEKTIYCLANSSLGFLALANKLFNQSKDVAMIKRWNSDIADVYTFLKALISWSAQRLKYSFNGVLLEENITNFHFMKKPFYAADLGFPEKIVSRNGKFRFNLLKEKPTLAILSRFARMMASKNHELGRDESHEIKELLIESDSIIPLEADGEIYFGKIFHIQTGTTGIRLCK